MASFQSINFSDFGVTFLVESPHGPVKGNAVYHHLVGDGTVLHLRTVQNKRDLIHSAEGDIDDG
jgi:hypothetical protein